MQTTLTVVTPKNNGQTPPGLLILLHGLTGNNAQWPSRVPLEPLADQHNLVIVCPDGHRSFWINQAYGFRFGDWVGSELPALMRSSLQISASRSDTLIGGLSMGGYGAFRAAFDHPMEFGAAFSLSGTLDVAEAAFRGRHPDLYEIGFGDDEHPRPSDDLVSRTERFIAPRPSSKATDETEAESSAVHVPDIRDVRLFASCGTEDELLEQNRLFAETADAARFELEYQEAAGQHDFEFWGHWLPIALNHVR